MSLLTFKRSGTSQVWPGIWSNQNAAAAMPGVGNGRRVGWLTCVCSVAQLSLGITGHAQFNLFGVNVYHYPIALHIFEIAGPRTIKTV